MTLATNAATVRAVRAQLEAWGWPSVLRPGYATRRNRQTPLVWESVMVHHTGGTATATSYMENPRDRPDLVVLCNAHITRSHTIQFVAAGGASHAGNGTRANYARMRAGKAPLSGNMTPTRPDAAFSANRLSFGIEVDGAGGAAEWDAWMLGATVALCAALHKVNGWDVPRVITHKEFTYRKPGDPSIDAGRLRTLVMEFLAAPYGPPGSLPIKLGSRVLGKDNGSDRGPDVAEAAALLKKHGYDVGAPLDEFGPAMDAAVRAFQTKHRLDVDGLIGPATLAALLDEQNPSQPDGESTAPEVPVEIPVEPTPEPVPTPVKVGIRFGQANLHAERWGGPDDDSAARGKFLRTEIGASIYALSEVTEDARNAIRKSLGAKWLTFPQGYSAVVWDGSKWEHKGRSSVSFGTRYHGAVRADLVNRATGLKLDVISLHVRPRAAFASDAAAATGKQADITKALSLIRKGVPTIVAGDFNTNLGASKLTAAGLVRATPAVDTSDTPGVQVLDQVWVTPDLVVRDAVLVNPGRISDHKVWRVSLTLTAAADV